MISALWLIAIVPASALFGFLCAALLCASAAAGYNDETGLPAKRGVDSITTPDEEEAIRECRRNRV